MFLFVLFFQVISCSYKLNGSHQLSLEELLSDTIKLPSVAADEYYNRELFQNDFKILEKIRSQGSLSHVSETVRRRILEVEEKEEDIADIDEVEEEKDLKSFFTKLGKK